MASGSVQLYVIAPRVALSDPGRTVAVEYCKMFLLTVRVKHQKHSIRPSIHPSIHRAATTTPFEGDVVAFIEKATLTLYITSSCIQSRFSGHVSLAHALVLLH